MHIHYRRKSSAITRGETRFEEIHTADRFRIKCREDTADMIDLIHRVTIWSRILGYTIIGQREKKRQWYSNLELFDSYNHKKGNASAKK